MQQHRANRFDALESFIHGEIGIGSSQVTRVPDRKRYSFAVVSPTH